MMMSKQTWAGMARATAAAALLAVTGLASAAPVVSFTVTDVADLNPGEDLWRYDYSVTGSAGMFDSINLLFSPSLYANLSLSGSDPLADTSSPVAQPDAGLAVDGMATVFFPDGLTPPDVASFAVDFTWLGGSRTPGTQEYQWVDDSFNPLGTGRTRDSQGGGTVPEPGALGLVAAALAGLALVRRQRRGV